MCYGLAIEMVDLDLFQDLDLSLPGVDLVIVFVKGISGGGGGGGGVHQYRITV
jgi:hypothetical protein